MPPEDVPRLAGEFLRDEGNWLAGLLGWSAEDLVQVWRDVNLKLGEKAAELTAGVMDRARLQGVVANGLQQGRTEDGMAADAYRVIVQHRGLHPVRDAGEAAFVWRVAGEYEASGPRGAVVDHAVNALRGRRANPPVSVPDVQVYSVRTEDSFQAGIDRYLENPGLAGKLSPEHLLVLRSRGGVNRGVSGASSGGHGRISESAVERAEGGISTPFDAWNSLVRVDGVGAGFLLAAAARMIPEGWGESHDAIRRAYARLSERERDLNTQSQAQIISNLLLHGEHATGLLRGGATRLTDADYEEMLRVWFEGDGDLQVPHDRLPRPGETVEITVGAGTSQPVRRSVNIGTHIRNLRDKSQGRARLTEESKRLLRNHGTLDEADGKWFFEPTLTRLMTDEQFEEALKVWFEGE
ncbi:hypothetical protein, partial [Streptomyces goshikiensis]|uniref:hypothetical protein n=1 Tax=Streptomyces goshikiensis TaxID=1942 RepID=UPI00378B5E4E